MTPLRIGVLGFGKAGVRHAAAAVESHATELVGVADSSTAASEQARGQGYPVVASLEELLAAKPDAVIVAVPHATLVDQAIEVTNARCHILVEKPMALRVEGARRLVQEAESAGVRLMVNFNHRFREEYRTAKTLVDSGEVGSPSLLVEHIITPEGALPEWVRRPAASGGGMMLYNGSHALDHLIWLADSRVAAIEARVTNRQAEQELEDTAVVSLQFESGALGSIVVHRSPTPDVVGGWQTWVYGTKGSVNVRTGHGVESCTTSGRKHIEVTEQNRFVAALEEFAAAVREKRAPSPDGTSAIHTVACLEAIYRSVREGSRVKVTD